MVEMRMSSRSDISLRALPAQVAESIAATAADVALLVAPDDEIIDIQSSLPAGSGFDEKNWRGKTAGDIVLEDSRGKISELINSARDGGPSRWRQVNHIQVANQDSLPIDYVALSASTQGHVLLLGRDLGHMASLQARLVKTQIAAQREYERYRAAESRYRELFELVGEPIMFLSQDDQVVIEANSSAGYFFLGDAERRSELVGLSFPDGVARLAGGDWNDAANAIVSKATSSGNKASAILADFPRADQQFRLNVSFRQSSDEHYLVLRVETTAVPSQQSEEPSLDALIDAAPDAFVLLDNKGRVRAANPGFAKLIELDNAFDARGRAFDEWLDQPGMTTASLVRMMGQAGYLASVPVKLRGRYGSVRETDASLVDLVDSAPGYVGMVLRDQDLRVSIADEKQNNLEGVVNQLTHLVGRIPLRDIVKETTDVIERMCIEAALELTQDNRASAAEMLGISRQSLYVKLRRFGYDGLGSDGSMEG